MLRLLQVEVEERDEVQRGASSSLARRQSRAVPPFPRRRRPLPPSACLSSSWRHAAEGRVSSVVESGNTGEVWSQGEAYFAKRCFATKSYSLY